MRMVLDRDGKELAGAKTRELLRVIVYDHDHVDEPAVSRSSVLNVVFGQILYSSSKAQG